MGAIVVRSGQLGRNRSARVVGSQRRAVADGLQRGAQLVGGVIRECAEARVGDDVMGISGGYGGAVVGGFEDDIAGQDEGGVGVGFEGLVCEVGVAGAEDLQGRPVDVELGFEGGGDVDLGEDPEAVFGEGVADRGFGLSDAVVGVGGYASGPLLKAATKKKAAAKKKAPAKKKAAPRKKKTAAKKARKK